MIALHRGVVIRDSVFERFRQGLDPGQRSTKIVRDPRDELPAGTVERALALAGFLETCRGGCKLMMQASQLDRCRRAHRAQPSRPVTHASCRVDQRGAGKCHTTSEHERSHDRDRPRREQHNRQRADRVAVDDHCPARGPNSQERWDQRRERRGHNLRGEGALPEDPHQCGGGCRPESRGTPGKDRKLSYVGPRHRPRGRGKQREQRTSGNDREHRQRHPRFRRLLGLHQSPHGSNR